MQRIRCAIYTRKSSEDGLEQEFNSLDAQREACEAYITSQKHEGWTCLADAYDDGGKSGGTLERPALKRLMGDIRAGRVDQVVVYKIDRLTRSLADFSKIVDVLDAAGASFVSVTQSFNTATSMGRLTLNMLLSFAQFEREVTAERIRDKIAASKRKGLWMGGSVPLGYAPDGRTLVIREPEADTVRTIYELYQTHKKLRLVKESLDAKGLKTAIRLRADGTQKGGTLFSIGHIHHILTNPVYAGRIRHKTKVYEGQHPALIDPEVWDALQIGLQAQTNGRRAGRMRSRGGRRTASSPLVGKLFDETGDRLTPSHSKTGKGKRLRYYVSHRLIRGTREAHPSAWRLVAVELEQAIAKLVAAHLNRPELQAGLLLDASAEETVVLSERLTGMIGQVEMAEMAAELLGLIERVDLAPGEMQLSLECEALAETLEIPEQRIAPEHLTFEAPFQQRKRGVETRLIIGNDGSKRDETLFRNIALGHRYFALIQSGKSYAEIAEQDHASKRMVQNLASLAFLAPDIVEAVWRGTQPTGLTSEWLKKNRLPELWSDQRALIAHL